MQFGMGLNKQMMEQLIDTSHAERLVNDLYYILPSHPILHEGSNMQNIFKLPSGFCCCLVCSKAMILLLFSIVAPIMRGFCIKFWFWQADDGQTLNAELFFQEIPTSMAKKPYIFVIFQGWGGGGGGGGPDPLSLPLSISTWTVQTL